MSDPSIPSGPAGISALPAVLILSALAFTAAILAFIGLGSEPGGPGWQLWLMTGLSLPLVLGGAALGPLLRATPVVEPSPLKLGLFSSALSPVLVALIWYGLAIGLELPVQQAWAGTFAAVGALAWLGGGRRLSAAPAGRAAALVCAIALLAAALMAAAVWSETGLRVRLSSSATIAQAAFAQSLQDGAHWDNPWVAGLPLELRPGIALLLVVVSGPAQLLPLYSLGFAIAWCAALLGIAGYLASAGLFRETGAARAGLRDVSAAVAVLLVAVALDGGRASVHRWLSMAYTMAFVVAALHAVRRGARPWPGLCACLAGILGVVHPWAALGAAGALGVAGLLALRPILVPLSALALLPGFWLSRMYGGFSLEQALPYEAPRSIQEPLHAKVAAFLAGQLGGPGEPSPWMWAAAYGPLVLGLLAVVVLAVRGGLDPMDRRPARLGAAFMGLLILAWLAVVAFLPADAQGERPGVMGAALLVSALALGRAVQCVPLGRASGLVAAVFLIGVGVPAYRSLDRVSPPRVPFKEHADHLALAADEPLKNGLAEALEFVRRSPYASDQRTILLKEPGPLGPVPRHELLSIAPILSGLPLFGDRAHSPGTDQSRAFAPRRLELRTDLGDTPRERREVLNHLFEYESKWQPPNGRVLDALRADGYTLLFIVTEADRRSTTDRGSGPRGTDDALRFMGAEEVFSGSEVSVYVAAPTAK